MKFPWWRHEERQSQLDEEIHSHIQMAKVDRMDRGESCRQAEQSARREFGNVSLVKDVTKRQWGWIWLEELLQDLIYGARMVRRSPGFTLVAVLTLVLGIGANTAIFSLVNGVLLRPMPFAQPERLVAPTQYYPKGAFVQMRDLSQTMDFSANTDNTEFNLTGKKLPARLTGNFVSANWFTILGVQPELGRVFRAGEDQPGKDNLVILSHSLWQQQFAGDPNILGRSIILEGINREVVGVMPADFKYPSPKSQLWVPLDLDPRNIGEYWGNSYMPLLMRLRPGVTIEQARLELATLRPKVLAAFAWRMPDDTWITASVVSLQEFTVGDARDKLLILLAAVGLLLLIACANVANLFLARATTREKEIALRTALGAGRWRLTRQLITESVLMTVKGGVLGVAGAHYALQILKSTLPADTPRLAEVTVDSRVLLFTAILCALTGIIFGLVPSVSVARLDVTKSLKIGGERVSSGNNRLSRTLVMGEVAVSVVLVIGAGLLVKSLWKLSTASPGFRPEAILTARISPNESFCESVGRCQTFYNDLLARLRALPQVKDVAAVNGLPLGTVWETVPSDIQGFAIAPGAHVPMLMERVITPDYLRVMGIPLLQGRALADADCGENAQRVVLIDKSTAERFWPGKNPIGEQVKPRWLDNWWTVVGVVGDVREYTMSRNLPEWLDGEIYTPYGPHAINGSGPERPPAELTLLIRTTQTPSELAGELQQTVSQLNSDVPVTQVATLHGWLAEAVASPRATALLFTLFAGLALVLGAVGVYGVISYSVSQRTREIGIRMALGARRREVLFFVVGQGAKLALVGVAAGLLAALLFTQLMSSLLYGVGAADPSTYLGVAILLVVVAVAASYIPARHAMSVDPIIALRYE
jgi:putative ABC transport system permease protein